MQELAYKYSSAMSPRVLLLFLLYCMYSYLGRDPTSSGVLHSPTKIPRPVMRSHQQQQQEQPNCPESLIDPLEVILCDEAGGIYRDTSHGITLQIPVGAIPTGLKLKISIGVLLHGNFDFPLGLSPVSAVLWLCTSQPNFTFLRPVKVTIPHFMECKSSDDPGYIKMHFVKALHKSSSAAILQFERADGMQEFSATDEAGILHTKHLCYLCITARINRRNRLRKKLCVSCAQSSPEITVATIILFYITYFLPTCMKVSSIKCLQYVVG